MSELAEVKGYFHAPLTVQFQDNLTGKVVTQDLSVVVSELIGGISMLLNVESLSNHEKTVLLARLANELTICAYSDEGDQDSELIVINVPGLM